MSRDVVIRPGRDADADGVIALVGACWSMYPGVILDVDGEVPELRALASYYAAAGGALWVADADAGVIGDAVATIVGMIATQPLEDGAWEICKVYVHPDAHGGGLAHRLLDLAEAHAMAAGATRLVLWSDTRFDRAHRFYEKRSYVRAGPIRVLDDISHSLEFAYGKPVDGVWTLDAAAAASAEPRLSALLASAAEAGRAPFRAPLARAAARAHWQTVVSEVAADRARLLVAWRGGTLVGVAVLTAATADTQPERAAITALLCTTTADATTPVDRSWTPAEDAVAATLLQAAAEEAVRIGRPRLTAELAADDPVLPAYRAQGWSEAGRLPGYAGGGRDAVLLFRAGG